MHHTAGRVLALVLCASSIWTTATAAATTCVKASSAPKGLCNVRGTFQKNVTAVLDKSTNPAKANSVQECALLCARHKPGCQTFEFVPASAACRLINLPGNMVYVRSNKSKKPVRIFNDASCYNCGDICKSGQPFGAQLLDNGGFESAYLGPWTFDNATMHTTRGTGDRAVTLNEKATFENVFYYPYYYYEISRDQDWAIQTFVNCPNEYYDVTFDYSFKMQQFTSYDYGPYGTFFGFSFAYLTLFDGNTILDRGTYFTFAPTNPLGVNGTWARGRVVSSQVEVNQFSISSSFSASRAFMPGNNTVSIDNVKLFRRPAPVPVKGSTSPPKLNGGFEKDNGLPWTIQTINGGPAIKDFLVSPGLDGSKRAVKLQQGALIGYTLINDKVPTVPNTLYILSVDVLHMNDVPESETALYVTLILRNVDNAATYEFDRSAKLGKKLTFSHPLFAQGNETSVEVGLTVNSGQNVLLVDNITLLPALENF